MAAFVLINCRVRVGNEAYSKCSICILDYEVVVMINVLSVVSCICISYDD